MKITFLLSSFGLSGGVQVIVEYANRLTARGHKVALVFPGGTRAAEMVQRTDPGIELIESAVVADTAPSLRHKLRLLCSLAVATPRSDILVSTHTPTTVVGLLAAHLLRKGRLIWLFQDYREMFSGRRVEAWLLRHALRWHTLALTVSTYCQQELQRYAPGRVLVVGEGLSDADQFRPVPVAKRPPSPYTRIFFLGDLRPRKGLADFLAAAAIVYQRHPALQLWIALKEPGDFVSAVPYRLIDRPSRAQLIELYASCDLFVSASWREGFGLPPLEAMACGTPVIMTDSGGVMEYAQPGLNALVVPPRRPDLLADAICHFLDNPRLATQFSANGPQIAARFQWAAAVDRFEAALLEVNKQG